MNSRQLRIAALPFLFAAAVLAADPPKPAGPTMAAVLAASKPGHWRPLDPENTLYVEFAAGRVVIELAPVFASNHVANVKALVREKYFDGLAVIREARRLKADIPVIIITGFSTEASAIEAVNLGVSGYLTKPFRVPRVLAAAAKALGE